MLSGLRRRLAGGRPEVTLEEAAARLTDRMRDREDAEFRQLVGNRAEMRIVLESQDDEATFGALRAAEFGEIGAVYLKIQSQRMVILGAGGSGKTVLLIKLARDLLDPGARHPTSLIPVRLSLANWDKERRTFDDWLLDEIEALPFPRGQAEQLLRHDLILPLLDGLDEMDPHAGDQAQAGPRSSAVFKSLHERVKPMVLTCRTEVYEAIAAGNEPVNHGFVGKVAALTADEIAARLVHADDVPDDWWNPVLIELSRDDSPLLTELATPWRLSIVSSLYGPHSESNRDPAVLVDDVRNPDQMLSHYADNLMKKTGHPGPTHRTLRSIARYLADNRDERPEFRDRRRSSVDFVVHQLWPIAGRGVPRLVHAVLAALFWLPTIGALTWFLGHSGFDPLLRIVTIVLVVGLAGWAVWSNSGEWPHPRKIDTRRIRTKLGWTRLGVAAATGAGLALVGALLGTPWFGAGLAVGYFASFGLGSCLAVRDSLGPLRLGLVSVGIALVLTVAAWAVAGERGLQIGVAAGLAVGGFTLVSSVPIALLVNRRADPGYVQNPVFKADFVRNDFLVGVMSGVFAGSAIYLSLISEHGFGLGVLPSVLCGLAITVTVAFGTVAQTWLRHVSMVVCRRGSVSPFLDSVLARAYHQGLLRRSGIAYQFRHVELQNYFAGQGDLTRD